MVFTMNGKPITRDEAEALFELLKRSGLVMMVIRKGVIDFPIHEDKVK